VVSPGVHCESTTEGYLDFENKGLAVKNGRGVAGVVAESGIQGGIELEE
jgi:hypothetical protein